MAPRALRPGLQRRHGGGALPPPSAARGLRVCRALCAGGQHPPQARKAKAGASARQAAADALSPLAEQLEPEALLGLVRDYTVAMSLC